MFGIRLNSKFTVVGQLHGLRTFVVFQVEIEFFYM